MTHPPSPSAPSRETEVARGPAAPDHAQVVVLPPLVYLGSLLVGAAARWLVALPLPLARGLRWSLGGILLAGGIAVSVAFARAFARTGQDRNPNTPTPSLITTGLYRYSRNPAYVALTAIQVAIGLLFDNGWILLVLIPVLLVMHYGVILREEAYLERKFGEEYARYKASVRRWL
jgi:protein-S-isoprenylcysteine O-methyltransferase Ste14